jgi:cytochrome d ubiquinol oxidase subunit I
MTQNLLDGRILMGSSLGFHIIFAVIGMGLPLFISLAELIGLWRKDSSWLTLARRWTSAFVILFAVGAATGMVVGQELALLWPRFMQDYGPVIALPFFIEVFAFFIEAIFLGIYVYAWDRFTNRWLHWLCSLPIVIGSMASGLLITIANAFMNSPAGFVIQNGKVVDIQPLAAMLNPATPTELLHTFMSAYLAVAFMLVGVTVWKMLHGRQGRYYQNALNLSMVVGLISAVGTFISGDLSGKYVAQYQPAKLAAMEALFHTQAGAPEIVGGIVDEKTQRIIGGIAIPKLLSFLSYGDFNHVVQGLDAFPKDQQPPVFIHYTFEMMIASGTYLLAIASLFGLSLLLRKQWPWLRRVMMSKLGMIAMLIGGPLGFLAIESGWMVTEIGRQPWIVYHYMRVSDALTTSPYVPVMLWIFLPFYAITAIATIYLLWAFFRRRPLRLPVEEAPGQPAFPSPLETRG